MGTPEPLAVFLVAHHLCVIFPLVSSSSFIQTINSLLDLNFQHLVLSTTAIIESLLYLDQLAKLYPQLRVIEPDAGERMLIASWWVVSDTDQRRILEGSILALRVFQEVKGGVQEAGEELRRLIGHSRSYHSEFSPSIERSTTPPFSPCRSIKRISPPNFCRPLPKTAGSESKWHQACLISSVVEEELFHAL